MKNAIFVIVSQKFKPSMSDEEIYDIARGDWSFSRTEMNDLEKFQQIKYALAVVSRKVVAAYEINSDEWERVGERWKFSGTARNDIRDKCADLITEHPWGRAVIPFNLEEFMAGHEKLDNKEDSMSDTAIELLQQFYQIIFHGPPGTGKTRAAKQVLKSIFGLGENDDDGLQKLQGGENGRWDIVQFHPSYNYEDFVRGIQAETIGGKVAYEMVNRIFGDMCIKAKAAPKGEKYALIIDEINRANVSAVLGELIYALEYRGEKVATPYSIDDKKELVIPKNLYVIGTMNTADRTIGQIDYAVRRRFAFYPCPPKRKVIESENSGLKERQKVLDIYDDVQNLFRKTNNDGFLSSDFDAADVCIGHSYFLPSDKRAENPLHQIAQKIIWQVVPILREYVKDGVLQESAMTEIEKIEGTAKELQAVALHITNAITPEFNEQCDWDSFGPNNQHPMSNYAYFYKWRNARNPVAKEFGKGIRDETLKDPKVDIAVCYKSFWLDRENVKRATIAMQEAYKQHPDFAELWLVLPPPHVPSYPAQSILVVRKNGETEEFDPTGKVSEWIYSDGPYSQPDYSYQIVLTAYPNQPRPAERQPSYFPQ